MLASNTVVQKYGGTSVGSVERIDAVAKRIATGRDRGIKNLAVVVSAMAGETNRLLDLVQQANPLASRSLYDLALSAGEQVSAALLAAALERHAVKAQPFLGFQLGIVTDSFHSQARIKAISTEKIVACWREGGIPIVAGFQGVTESLQVTTLGRGGSDTSAVALAAALQADYCEINTDVDGVFSADPRCVQNAKLLSVLDFSTALEMATLGSKVLHSRCVELAAKFELPLVVRNSFNETSSERTLIMNLDEKQAIESPVVSGVSGQRGVSRIGLYGVSKDARFISQVFSAIAAAGVNVDIIVHHFLSEKDKMRLGFTVDDQELQRTKEVLQRLLNEKGGGFTESDFEAESGLGKVSIVGLGMQSHHGVASRMFTSLTGEGIDIKMISTSEIKVSCVIPENSLDQAVQVLHRDFCE